MASDDQPPLLDYDQVGKSLGLIPSVLYLCGRLLIVGLLFLAAVFIPHPTGIWYFFGSRPSWLISIDEGGLSIGSASNPIQLGWITLIFLKLLIIALPLWFVQLIIIRNRRSRVGEAHSLA